MARAIPWPRVEGIASRQAHCDLPPDTYARDALQMADLPAGAEWTGYVDSWRVEPA